MHVNALCEISRYQSLFEGKETMKQAKKEKFSFIHTQTGIAPAPDLWHFLLIWYYCKDVLVDLHWLKFLIFRNCAWKQLMDDSITEPLMLNILWMSSRLSLEKQDSIGVVLRKWVYNVKLGVLEVHNPTFCLKCIVIIKDWYKKLVSRQRQNECNWKTCLKWHWWRCLPDIQSP